MHIKNWTDLRYLLAIQRMRTLAKTAKLLKVDVTTVSRRLSTLQAEIGRPLVVSQGEGVYELTAAGHAVAREAEAIEQRIKAIEKLPDQGGDPVAGTVRLTSVPIIVNRLLVVALAPLLRQHPDLTVELIAESRDYSLTRREADLALRLARPTLGGSQLKVRRVATWTFLPFAAAKQRARKDADLPWITYDDAMAHLPQAVWITRAARAHPSGLSSLRVHDAETALEAAASGLGIALLPSLVAARDRRLRQVEQGQEIKPLTRDLWLIGHADQLPLPPVARVTSWIDQIFGGVP